MDRARLTVAIERHRAEFIVALIPVIHQAVKRAQENKAKNDRAVDEAKRQGGDGRFDEGKHPRDDHGRFE